MTHGAKKGVPENMLWAELSTFFFLPFYVGGEKSRNSFIERGFRSVWGFRARFSNKSAGRKVSLLYDMWTWGKTRWREWDSLKLDWWYQVLILNRVFKLRDSFTNASENFAQIVRIVRFQETQILHAIDKKKGSCLPTFSRIQFWSLSGVRVHFYQY